MERRPIVIIAAVVALVFVCGLCALTVFGTVTWLGVNRGEVRIFDRVNTSVEVTESLTFEALPSLEVVSDNGNITVTAAEIDQIEVEIVKTGWGSNQDEARAAAEALVVTVEETGETLRLVFEAEEGVDIAVSRGGRDRVSFTIRVPTETAVDLTTSFGDVLVTGVTGLVQIEDSFGEVVVRDVRGEGADILLKTSFGDLILEESQAQEVRLETSNGVIEVRQLAAGGDVFLETSFGDVRVEDVTSASLTVENRNGGVRVDEGEIAGTVEVTSSFGDVVVAGVEASAYTLHTTNGKVSAEGASGPLDLKSSFGDIEVMGAVEAVLDLKTTNGVVRFAGSLDPAADHVVETSFGDIFLALPADSALDLQLETSFGEIDSELPVTLTGALERDFWDAELNGGGSLLKTTTTNGNITLEALVTDR